MTADVRAINPGPVSEDDRPRVSVVVPNYNHARFLPARLESILDQTYQDFELLLLDDASTDDSVPVLQRYTDRPHTRLVVNTRNSGGPFAQWNRGVELAGGEYVWLAESDDLAAPELLQTLVDVLDGDETLAFACCDSIRIDANGKSRNGSALQDEPPVSPNAVQPENAPSPVRLTLTSLYVQNRVPSASAVVFRRSVYRACGPADASYRLSGDWQQWAKLLQQRHGLFLPQPLNFTRIHADTQRASFQTNGQLELESARVQRAMRQWQPVPRELVEAGAERLATSWLQHVRSGRYDGSLTGHLRMAGELLRADLWTGVRFLLRWSGCIVIFCLKRTLFRRRCERPQSG